jgi:phage terminase large subunit
MRVLDKNGELFCTMTPLKGLTWVYERIFLNRINDPDVWQISMSWADNPYLNAKTVAAFGASMSDTELKRRRDGAFIKDTGLVYPEFNETVHAIEPFAIYEGFQCGISIDPGFRNPTSAHFYAVDNDGCVYVVAEYYEREKTPDEVAAALFKIADELKWKRTRDGKLEALIDPAALSRGQSGAKSLATLYFERGISVNTKVDKTVFSGITEVKRYFSENRLFVFRNCVNLIKELKSYWWGDDETPKKENDHAMDELRYFIMSRPKPAISEKEPENFLLKHFNSLAKKSNANH